jgi:hypothetical protein
MAVTSVAYPSDLSDRERALLVSLSPCCRQRSRVDAPVPSICAGSLMGSSTCCAAAANGASSRANMLPGRRSVPTGARGGGMGRGNGSARRCANGSVSRPGGSQRPAPQALTANRSRRPNAAVRTATMWPEALRPQTPSARRYTGLGRESAGPSRRPAGPRQRSATAAHRRGHPAPVGADPSR